MKKNIPAQDSIPHLANMRGSCKAPVARHPGEGGGAGRPRKTWIPAFGEMTFRRLISFVSTYQHKKNP
jgi:hypothetical protein